MSFSKIGVLAVMLLSLGSLAYAAEGTVQTPASWPQFLSEHRSLQPKEAYKAYQDYLRDFGKMVPKPTLATSQIRTEKSSEAGSFEEFRNAHRDLSPKEAYRAYQEVARK